jgi:hypothetical protein
MIFNLPFSFNGFSSVKTGEILKGNIIDKAGKHRVSGAQDKGIS